MKSWGVFFTFGSMKLARRAFEGVLREVQSTSGVDAGVFLGELKGKPVVVVFGRGLPIPDEMVERAAERCSTGENIDPDEDALKGILELHKAEKLSRGRLGKPGKYRLFDHRFSSN